VDAVSDPKSAVIFVVWPVYDRVTKGSILRILKFPVVVRKTSVQLLQHVSPHPALGYQRTVPMSRAYFLLEEAVRAWRKQQEVEVAEKRKLLGELEANLAAADKLLGDLLDGTPLSIVDKGAEG
jgi:hypothetical protein